MLISQILGTYVVIHALLMLVYKLNVLKSFFGYPKTFKVQLSLSKMLEPKSSKLWLCPKEMELESSGSGSTTIFGAKS